MRRFWIRFDLSIEQPHPAGSLIGCGVTANSEDEALSLIKDRVFKDTLPPILEVIEDVDVTELDRSHVVPNMGDPSVKGIWFPLGY